MICFFLLLLVILIGLMFNVVNVFVNEYFNIMICFVFLGIFIVLFLFFIEIVFLVDDFFLFELFVLL